MKMDFLMSLLSFQGLTVWSLLAQLWPGKAPPPCSPFLKNGARGSPNHSRGSDTDLPQSLRRDISKGQKGKLRNKEHLSNRYSLSQLCEGLHEDMVHTKQESCQ